MVNKFEGEPEESKIGIQQSDFQNSYANKSKSGKLKSNKVFTSEDYKYGVNVISLNISPDLSLFKKIAEESVEKIDDILDSEEDINKQILSKNIESKFFV